MPATEFPNSGPYASTTALSSALSDARFAGADPNPRYRRWVFERIKGSSFPLGSFESSQDLLDFVKDSRFGSDSTYTNTVLGGLTGGALGY